MKAAKYYQIEIPEKLLENLYTKSVLYGDDFDINNWIAATIKSCMGKMKYEYEFWGRIRKNENHKYVYYYKFRIEQI